eukprot:343802_1
MAIEYAIVPKKYKCFKCQSIGNHWIMNCSNSVQYEQFHEKRSENNKWDWLGGPIVSSGDNLIMYKRSHIMIYEPNTRQIYEIARLIDRFHDDNVLLIKHSERHLLYVFSYPFKQLYV